MGLTWEEVEASAQDRQTWRQRVALHRRCWMNQVESSHVDLLCQRQKELSVSALSVWVELT